MTENEKGKDVRSAIVGEGNEPRKDIVVWSGIGTLYETETDLGFAPGVTLPEDFPWECRSQKVKVTLELIED